MGCFSRKGQNYLDRLADSFREKIRRGTLRIDFIEMSNITADYRNPLFEGNKFFLVQGDTVYVGRKETDTVLAEEYVRDEDIYIRRPFPVSIDLESFEGEIYSDMIYTTVA